MNPYVYVVCSDPRHSHKLLPLALGLQVADGDAGHGAVDLQPLADHGGSDQLGLASWRHQERL